MKLSGEAQAVLLKYALIAAAGYFIYTKIKSTAGDTIDFVKNIDLNPFDQNGWLGLTLPPATEQNPRISGYDASHIEAMRKIGLDINNYSIYYPDPLQPLDPYPAGTIKIKWGVNREKITLYAPKKIMDIFKF